MEQLDADDQFLPILLREGTVGSEAFKTAVDTQLQFFEEELCSDLVRLADLNGTGIAHAPLVAKAITRLVFAMAGSAMDQPRHSRPALIEEMVVMVRMIIVGTQSMAANPKLSARDQ